MFLVCLLFICNSIVRTNRKLYKEKWRFCCMVLVKPLSKEEVERHENLIREYFSQIQGQDHPEIVFVDNGNEKGVYRVETQEGVHVAVAANRDYDSPGGTLLQEYNILHALYSGAPEFFPKPKAHYQSSTTDVSDELLVMEFLPHLNVMRHADRAEVFDRRKFAYLLGEAVAKVNAKTGRFSSDPHDGNILLRGEGQDLELKFCDAIQFKTGSLEDGVRSILVDRNARPEAYRFIHRFKEGLARGIEANQGIPFGEAKKSLDYMNEYNDIA